MDKQITEFAVQTRGGIVTRIGKSYVSHPPIHFSGGTVKWHEDRLKRGCSRGVSADGFQENLPEKGEYFMKKFIFRGKETGYAWHWMDKNTLVFDFGDGEFTDAEGDAFFMHCEYHADSGESVFTVCWDEDSMEAGPDYISDSEKEYAVQFMKYLSGGSALAGQIR